MQQEKVLIIAASDSARRNALEQAGAEVILLPGQNQRVDLSAVCIELARRGCNEIMLEAGGTLAGAFLQAQLIDEVILYQAPIFLGKGHALANFSLASLTEKLAPKVIERRVIADDQRYILRFTPLDRFL